MTESEEAKSRQVGQALLAVASSLQAVAHAMLGENEKKSNDVDHKKKTKKEKDPNAPRRNLTSYIYFVLDVRQSVVDEDPSLSAIEVARILGKKWNSLSDKEKQPYIDLAEEDKNRFNKELDEYKTTHGIETTPSKKSNSTKVKADESKKADEPKKRPAPASAAPATEAPSKKKTKAAKTNEVKPEPKQEKKKSNKKK